jgi:hypothetical protein
MVVHSVEPEKAIASLVTALLGEWSISYNKFTSNSSENADDAIN